MHYFQGSREHRPPWGPPFKPAFYQGNSRAIDSLLLYLTYTQFGDVTRSNLRKRGAILNLGCLSFHHSAVILSVCHHFLSTQYLENNFIEFAQFCMCIDIDLFSDMI